MIKSLKPSPRLHFSTLLAFKRWILIVGRAKSPTKKKKPQGFKKKKRPRQLTVSSLPWQEPTITLAKIRKKLEKIVAIDNQIV